MTSSRQSTSKPNLWSGISHYGETSKNDEQMRPPVDNDNDDAVNRSRNHTHLQKSHLNRSDNDGTRSRRSWLQHPLQKRPSTPPNMAVGKHRMSPRPTLARFSDSLYPDGGGDVNQNLHIKNITIPRILSQGKTHQNFDDGSAADESASSDSCEVQARAPSSYLREPIGPAIMYTDLPFPPPLLSSSHHASPSMFQDNSAQKYAAAHVAANYPLPKFGGRFEQSVVRSRRGDDLLCTPQLHYQHENHKMTDGNSNNHVDVSNKISSPTFEEDQVVV